MANTTTCLLERPISSPSSHSDALQTNPPEGDSAPDTSTTEPVTTPGIHPFLAMEVGQYSTHTAWEPFPRPFTLPFHRLTHTELDHLIQQYDLPSADLIDQMSAAKLLGSTFDYNTPTSVYKSLMEHRLANCFATLETRFGFTDHDWEKMMESSSRTQWDRLWDLDEQLCLDASSEVVWYFRLFEAERYPDNDPALGTISSIWVSGDLWPREGGPEYCYPEDLEGFYKEEDF